MQCHPHLWLEARLAQEGRPSTSPSATTAPPHALLICRVLKRGGRFLCLEFSKVVVPGLQQLYDAYSFNVIPQIGRQVL